ncbi:MAG: DUF4197 domain-containing protein [Hyphomonadaceae bacterium]|nr:DUF4197 domain-containing protein [Hyphomonadaceae bacterium]
MQNQFSRRGLVFAAAAFAMPAWAAQPLLDSLTQGDATRGIRDALGLGAMNAVTRLGQPNGFFGEPRVRIPLPGLLGTAQTNLRGFGFAGPLDALQEEINHAAERTMPAAGRLFLNAVRDMTIGDAIDIVRGPDNSATLYLRERTETGLTRALRTPMRDTLTSSGVFTLLREALRQVGMASMTNNFRDEIVDFSTAKALDGAFLYIGDEERAIRRDPARRTTDILRRVFG